LKTQTHAHWKRLWQLNLIYINICYLGYQFKLSCDSRFQCAFTACSCVFRVIIGSNQSNFFENATVCSKRMLKTRLATQLYEIVLFSRLDCGTGPGIVRSASRANLGRWNRLTVFRHDWGVWLQLNGGVHEEGRSQVMIDTLPHTISTF
jgi:hypothetical protein